MAFTCYRGQGHLWRRPTHPPRQVNAMAMPSDILSAKAGLSLTEYCHNQHRLKRNVYNSHRAFRLGRVDRGENAL